MYIWEENNTYNSRTTHLLTCISHTNAHTYSTDTHMEKYMCTKLVQLAYYLE